jgi:hypothetical protein
MITFVIVLLFVSVIFTIMVGNIMNRAKHTLKLKTRIPTPTAVTGGQPNTDSQEFPTHRTF